MEFLNSNALIAVIAILTVFNTFSKWTSKKDTDITHLEREVSRIGKTVHENSNLINEWAKIFVQKEDFHEELTRLYRAISDKVNK